MLTVEVRVNGHLISSAHIRNTSELADLSNYEFTAASKPSPVTGAASIETKGEIKRHNRLQSAWALVEKVAGRIAANEGVEVYRQYRPLKESTRD